MSDNPSDKYSLARQLGMLTIIPFLLGVSPLVGFFMGRWLDRRLGTEPVLTWAFLALGFVAGIRETVRILRKANRAGEEADRIG